MRDKAQKDRVNHPVQLGEKNNAHKLTEQQVREIRRRYIPRDPKNGQYALGREFGVNHSTIWAVLKGLNWKDVH
jgi:hypothetical protein